jgi:RNA polymerase sigma-70 factor (ECF subfamily)
MFPGTDNSSETNRLLQGTQQGRAGDWQTLLDRHRERLRRMVALRLDVRLHGRVDPADVVRLACQEASARQAEYLHDPRQAFFLWLRTLAGRTLVEVHRRHLTESGSAAEREFTLQRAGLPQATAAALAAQLLGPAGRPSEAGQRAERAVRLREAFNSMDPLDREVLALRHFEQLSNREAAAVLGIEEAAASRRYLDALKRLRQICNTLPSSTGERKP